MYIDFAIIFQCMHDATLYFSIARPGMASSFPTYGEPIAFLEAAERECDGTATAEILALKVSMKYPDVPICRPSRFLDTVKRQAAPTKLSPVGPPKLTDSPLCSYLRREWLPRTRNVPGTFLQVHLTKSCI